MKVVFAQSLVVLAGVVLVALFVAVALLVGAQAATVADGPEQRLVLAALALGGAFFGGVRGLKGQEASAREGHDQRRARRARTVSPTLP